MGSVVNREDLIRELMYPDPVLDADENWISNGVQVMSRENAKALIDRHKDIYDRGVKLASYTYYVAAEILKAEFE